ncbi:MAG TPA: hypothetical protein VF131_08425 [Blastocatellia bacterium]|nr:hypothetical protein [Blastocatellia bacterium]
MKLMKSLGQGRLTLVVLALASAAFMSVAIFSAAAVPTKKGTNHSGPCGADANLNEQVRRGVGSEVHFASSNSKVSDAQVAASVESIAGFIYERSNLGMSEATKKRLIAAELGVARGTARRISIEEMTDSLTQAVLARVATLTDEEIERAAETFTTQMGSIFTRACGKWGVLSKGEFVEQVKTARDWSRRGNSAVRAALRPFVQEEVNERASYLSHALPEQFGNIESDGVTPLQAVLITYSVAADDRLTGSKSDIAAMMVEKRMDARQTRAEKQAQNPDSGRPYGVKGVLYSSPAHHLLNKEAVDNLLSIAEGGGIK